MKTRCKWVLCVLMGVLLLATGSEALGERSRGMGPGNLPPLTTPQSSDLPPAETVQVRENRPAATTQTNEPPSIATAQTASNGVLLVNAVHPLPDGFSVRGLVKLYDGPRSFQLATSDIRLTQETCAAANQMFEQARQEGVTGFTITSGYRTDAEQRALYQNGSNEKAAKPGTSEHQTGLAFDVTTRYDGGGFEDTEQFRWLSENCWDFGFILRYPDGKKDITGIPYEPWHYRYVGTQIAQEIHENGWTLEEYCERNGI